MSKHVLYIFFLLDLRLFVCLDVPVYSVLLIVGNCFYEGLEMFLGAFCYLCDGTKCFLSFIR